MSSKVAEELPFRKFWSKEVRATVSYMEKIGIYKERQFCYTQLMGIFDTPLYSLNILLLHLLLILP